MQEQRKVYEVSFHIISTVSEKDAMKKQKEIISHLEKLNCEIIGEELPALMDLAYEIQHTTRDDKGVYDRYTTSYFASIKFRGDATTPLELRKILKEDKIILRSLIFSTLEKDTHFAPPVEETEETPVKERGKVKVAADAPEKTEDKTDSKGAKKEEAKKEEVALAKEEK